MAYATLALVLVLFAAVFVAFVAYVDESGIREADPYEGSTALRTRHPSQRLADVILENGRPFHEAEWAAVEASRTYLERNPDACVDDLLYDVRPGARCSRLSARAWWADVVAPGLAAATAFDLDRYRRGERATPTAALREHASGLPGVPFGADAPFRREYARTRPADGIGSFAATLPGPYSVAAVDPDTHRVTVAGDGERARFAIVDRSADDPGPGDLAVAPVSEAYRRETVDGPPAEWVVQAANALEAVLPARFDDLDAPDSPWPTAPTDDDGGDDDGSDSQGSRLDVSAAESAESVSVVQRRVAAPAIDAFDCEVDGTDVVVRAGGETAELVVDDRGVVRFESFDARSSRDYHWATRAVTAADAAVHGD